MEQQAVGLPESVCHLGEDEGVDEGVDAAGEREEARRRGAPLAGAEHARPRRSSQ